MNTAQTRDAFETGDEPQPIEITIRGQTRTYLLQDIPASASDVIFEPIVIGTDAEKRQGQREFRDRIISSCVLRADGSPISIDEARSMRSQLATKLSAAALAFLNPPEDDGKNASSGTTSGAS